MNSIVCEMKKNLYPPFFLLSCIGVILTCCISEGYVSVSDKTYTIIELLLFLRKDTMLADVYLNRYEIWTHGIGIWSQLLFPFLLSISYLYTISTEKQSCYNRLLLVRENNLTYSISKLVSAILSGGILLLTGYLIFGMIVYMRFPSIQEYSLDSINQYMVLYPDFREAAFCFENCIRVLLYGMCINVFAYLVSVFFRDKYILICLPLMLKYIWGQVILKLENVAMHDGKDTLLNLCSSLRLESILNIRGTGYWWLTLLLICLIYLFGFFLILYRLKKRGEEFGFE